MAWMGEGQHRKRASKLYKRYVYKGEQYSIQEIHKHCCQRRSKSWQSSAQRRTDKIRRAKKKQDSGAHIFPAWQPIRNNLPQFPIFQAAASRKARTRSGMHADFADCLMMVGNGSF